MIHKNTDLKPIAEVLHEYARLMRSASGMSEADAEAFLTAEQVKRRKSAQLKNLTAEAIEAAANAEDLVDHAIGFREDSSTVLRDAAADAVIRSKIIQAELHDATNGPPKT